MIGNPKTITRTQIPQSVYKEKKKLKWIISFAYIRFLYFFAKALPTFVILPSKLILITLWKGKVYTSRFLFNFVLNTLDVFCHTTFCQLLRINDIIVFLWNFESFFIFLRRWKFESWNVQSHFFFILIISISLRIFFFLRRINLRISLWNHEPKLLTILMGRCNFAHTVLVRCKRVEPTLPTTFLLINKYNFFF